MSEDKELLEGEEVEWTIHPPGILTREEVECVLRFIEFMRERRADDEHKDSEEDEDG